MDKHFIDLLRGATGGLVARVIAAVAVFLLGVFLARLLGAADSGLFYLALALVTVLAVVCRVGLDGSVVRFVAAHLARGEPAAAGAIYRRSIILISALAVVASALLYVGADAVSRAVFAKPELVSVLQGMVWLLFPLALLMIHGQFMQAEKRVADAVIVQTGLLPLLSIAAFALLPVSWSLSNVVTVYTSAALLTLVISVVWYLRSRTFDAHRGEGYDFGGLAASARSLAVSDLINKVVQPWAPVIFLGLWGTAAHIGLFAAANRLAALTVFATLPVNRMLAPKMSALWAEGDTAAFFRLSRQAALLMVCVSLPIALALILVPEFLLGLFGEEFVAARNLLWILAAGQLFNALTGPVRSMLIMTGHEKDHRMSSIAGGVVILGLCIFLIPAAQATGAALAAAAGMVVNNLYAAFLVWRRLGVIPLWK